ncbi:hypothetical protein BXY85_0037 [Roseivirga pacifica]|uniref:DUF779 domain-containing protein n=2 Tax=Roseivirga pacifica TaxID=1267423 RepID=A0A1I0R5A9_9BACT|nr:DUF779 domain-containing protein [Roseivirga pacifica]RKQ49050.1 hypothetical protein BXY85_0037 [Roseivirga pacifica]SEW35694.1 hypothetical protein SAMN05216290_3090 [Roseivirga pacifica]
MTVARVIMTDEAKAVVDKLRQQYPALIFHQSGGCCDGSAPMCLEKDDLILNENDVWLGAVHRCDFYMSKDQFEYWQHTQLTIDVTKGRGASFSLEIPLGLRFVTKSRLFTEDEMNDLSLTRLASEQG